MSKYKARPWESFCSLGAAVVLIGLFGFLLVRNEPVRDQTLVAVYRLLISVTVAILGGIIPGFLNFNWAGRGLAIRAGGALALFVIAFMASGTIISLTNSSAESSRRGTSGVQQSSKGNCSPNIVGGTANMNCTGR